MIATAENRRNPSNDLTLVWHLMLHSHTCTGDCDFHPILCAASTDEGIAMPSRVQDVPTDLFSGRPGEQWCTACLATAGQS